MNILLGLAVVAVVGTIAGLVFAFNDFNTGWEFYSIGDSFELKVAPNHLISCTIEDIFQIRYEDGRTVNAVWATDTFKPLIKYEVVQRHTRETLKSFPSDIYLKCDIPNNAETTVEGSFLVVATATDSTGKEVQVYSERITVSKRTLQDNVKIKLPSYLIKKADIDAKLDAGDGDYNSWVVVHVAPFLKFKIPIANSESLYSATELRTAYLAKILKEPPPSKTAALGTQTNIITFDPKVFQKPLTSPNSRFITVIGQIDHFKIEEGIPYVQLTDSTGKQSQKIRFTSYQNDDKDKWTEFKVTFALPEDVKSGIWTLIMKSDQPTRSQSTRTFEVLDAGSKPTSSGDTAGGSQETGGNTAKDVTIPAKVKVKYQVLYQGGEVLNNVAEEQGFSVDLQQIQLTNDIKDHNDVRYASTRLEPYLVFDSREQLNQFTPVSVDMNYETVITFQDQKLVLPAIQNKVTDFVNKNDFGIQLDTVLILADDIENQIVNSGLQIETETRYPVNIVVNIHGDIVLKDKDGNRYTGLVDGAAFEHNTFYTKNVVEKTDDDPAPEGKEKDANCITFFDYDVFDCKDDTTTTDGTVETVDTGDTKDDSGNPLDDLVGDIKDKAITTIGEAVICDQLNLPCVEAMPDTLQNLIDEAKNKPNYLLIGGIGLAVIIVIALIAKLAKGR